MSAELLIMTSGRVRLRGPLTAFNAPHVAAALARYLPEIVRLEGTVAAAVEKDGVVHIIHARIKETRP